jgi:hypothetical protein
MGWRKEGEKERERKNTNRNREVERERERKRKKEKKLVSIFSRKDQKMKRQFIKDRFNKLKFVHLTTKQIENPKYLKAAVKVVQHKNLSKLVS